MKAPHTGAKLESVVLDCLKQWGIDKKIFSITLDNASANNTLQDILRAIFVFREIYYVMVTFFTFDVVLILLI